MHMHRFGKVYLVFLIILLGSRMLAQSPADWWYFGDSAGVHFQGGSPVAVFDGQMIAYEGCASISNSNGELLFYSNGVSVWNREHQIMPNGSGLIGDLSSSQSTVVAPWPGSSDRFILVTVRGCTADQNLYDPSDYYFAYSVVDMSLDNGLGDIVDSLKNVILFDSSAEQCAIVPHANGDDLWLIGREMFSPLFRAFHLSSNGISGTTNSVLGNIGACPGYLMSNHKGDKLIAPIYSPLYNLLLNFNQLTGLITIQDTIPTPSYGTHFSPNDSLLYLSKNFLFQYEVYAPSVYLSGVQLAPLGDGNLAIAEGPDKKLYLAKTNFSGTNEMRYLNRIDNPNVPGLGCGYMDSAVAIGIGIGLDGLPNFISPSVFKVNTISASGSCVNDTIFFTFNTAYVDSVHWTFGDPGSGAQDTSSTFSAFHIYSDSGSYLVELVVFYGDFTDTLLKEIFIGRPPMVDLGNDWDLCQTSDDSIKLSAAGAMGAYSWSNGSTDSTTWIRAKDLAINQIHPISLIVSNTCGADTDTVLVSVAAKLNFTLGSDTAICGDSLLIFPTVLNAGTATNYTWSSGDTTPFVTVHNANASTDSIVIALEVENVCGSANDSTLVTFLPKPDGKLPTDSVYCLDRPFYLLNTQTKSIQYLWNDGTTGPQLRVDSSGTFWLKSFNECDTLTDTFSIEFNGEPKLALGDDVFLCPGESILLQNLENDVSVEQSWTWSTGSVDSTLVVSATPDGTLISGESQFGNEALITLGAKFKKCQVSDSVKVVAKGFCPDQCKPAIPNVFTPNQDGVNDHFSLGLKCPIDHLSLSIYNRWGQLVYETGELASLLNAENHTLEVPIPVWDGRINGTLAASGSYYYQLNYSKPSGEIFNHNGVIQLISSDGSH